MVHTSVSYSQTLRGRFGRRLTQVGLAVCLIGLAVAGTALLVLTIVSIPLVLLSIGIPLCIGAVWLTRGLTRAERALYRRINGDRIEQPYGRWPKGHIGMQLLALTRDVTVWRDIAWHAVNLPLGLLVHLTTIALFLSPFFYLVYPVLWWSWPNVFNSFFGLFHFDTLGGALWAWPIAGVMFTLWWWLGDLLQTSYAKLAALLLRPTRSARLQQRVEQLTESRADTVDSSAAELRRIERDLHDGAQARLVALGMSLGMAEELLDTDPAAAARLLAEARENSGAALVELRNLVRGIHPPVLADRGLAKAVEALALAHPLPVTVTDDLPGRPPAPVESAAYFAIAEALTNVAKYAGATTVRVRIGHFGALPAPGARRHEDQPVPRLGITIRDDGHGGARVTPGGGLDGLVRRLAAFDGTVTVTSPEGGPTVIALEIPCELTAVASA
ncbi:signal transduction histidine kinase [Stackebrandtia albiflava]|uniref:histidine kinase n=1 Tax=Stackebrandtia albiflava TaxID=406432 RepID=A0A562UYS2_9ACTN|nr:sensor histidine kinase [Stackebrandtia albiflava]TWJ10755.1 signal transduction histidine kinase [Stackebrandtia albiflava]